MRDLLYSAEQARRNTLSTEEVQLNKVAVAIKEAINSGWYNICLQGKISDGVISELLDLGYDVGVSNNELVSGERYPQTLTYISWKE